MWDVLQFYLSYPTTALLAVLVTLVLVRLLWPHHRKLPPGPFCLPVVGYHPFLGAEPHLVLHKLRQKFGPIFGITIGSRYCVVLSDFKAIKEAYNKNAFSGRPPNYFMVSKVHPNIVDMNGKDWEEQRKFTVNTLRALGMGKNRLKEIILDEISRVVPKMESVCQGSAGADVNIRDVITPALNNAILMMICNRWLEDDHPAMQSLILFQKLTPESFSSTSAPIYFPWFKWFLLNLDPRLRVIWKSIMKMERVMREEIAAREEHHTSSSCEDYVDYFLTEVKAAKGHTTFKKEILTTNSLSMLQAGAETIRNTLEWSFICMAANPEVQERVFREISIVIGLERTPTWEDKGKLPYTEAVIMETERWKTLVILNCLRYTTEATSVGGFNIPKDTIVINNLWSCHMDPEYWDQPEDFRPERFLSKDGLKAITPEYFMPFSLGKRDCPGDKMAIMEIFLYFTSLIQRFQYSAPEGGVSFENIIRINDIAVKPVLRVQVRL